MPRTIPGSTRILLSLPVALALALAGCGGGDVAGTPTPTPTTTPTEAAASEAPTAEPTDAADNSDATEAPTDATPSEAEDEQAAGDCAAAGLDLTVDAAADLPAATRDTATFLLDAAVRCDEQLVHTAATESDTTFHVGNASVDDVFALPEDPAEDPAAWEALARLLGGTTPVEDDGIWSWPAAHGADADEAAWQELVDSGLYSEAEVDQLRSGEGYLGWRVGIDADGRWLFMAAGD